MTALRDTAKAKLNLTLEVLGRRADFYHEVRSLVGFTDLGDSVALEPGDELALAVDGPFAGALEGDNLIIAAAEATKSEAPGIALGRFELTKALPVAAGLGGGSADAAAALRLLAEANPETLSATALVEIAGRLGSDVTACLASRPALMTGRGEHVADVRGFPACGWCWSIPACRSPPQASTAHSMRRRFQPLQRILSRCLISAEASSA